MIWSPEFERRLLIRFWCVVGTCLLAIGGLTTFAVMAIGRCP